MKKNALDIGLDVDQLEMILVKAIPLYSIEKEIKIMSKKYRGLGYRFRSRGCKFNKNEENDIVAILREFLTTSPSLPSSVVALTHSMLGIILARQKLHYFAIESFLKAFWIYYSNAEENSTQVAITAHRLGLEYGSIGDYRYASALLEKALDRYKKENHYTTLHLINNATVTLKAYQLKEC